MRVFGVGGRFGGGGEMKFIIHSKQLMNLAIDYEKESGEKCYIPCRDTIQDNGDNILPRNFEALRDCDIEVPVFWDGGSLGTMFDMGMAYALGKKIIPMNFTAGRNWQEYFKSKIGDSIEYRPIQP